MKLKVVFLIALASIGGACARDPSGLGILDAGPDIGSHKPHDAISASQSRAAGGDLFFSPTAPPPEMTFTTKWRHGVVGYIGYAALADLNHDMNPDLILTTHEGRAGWLRVYLGKGDGSFTEGTVIERCSPWETAVADLNNDGRADLVARVYCDGEIWTVGLIAWLGNGDGTFSEPLTIDNCCETYVLGDFDRDGIVDLIAAGTEEKPGSEFSFRRGRGDGTFAAPVNAHSLLAPIGELKAANLNDDGFIDLVVTTESEANHLNPAAGITTLLGNGDGTFRTSAFYAMQVSSPPDSVSYGDYYRTGRVDIAVSDLGSDSMLVFKGDGTGALNQPTSYATGHQPSTILASDLKGDGQVELLNLTGIDLELRAVFGLQTDTPRVASLVGPDQQYPYNTFTVGDCDGDGYPEIVWLQTEIDAETSFINVLSSRR